ncbi:MAG TPA: hypothetical protein VGG80_05830 [Acidobacteriaceae bacterium]|jgi:hypothetical protein
MECSAGWQCGGEDAGGEHGEYDGRDHERVAGAGSVDDGGEDGR